MFENPLREGLRLERTPEPCTVVIFGASGDLTQRKLLPALYNLARQNLLPSGFSIVGTGRTAMTDKEFRGRMKRAVQQFGNSNFDSRIWEAFTSGIFYHPSDPGDKGSFESLSYHLSQVDQQRRTSGNRLFYLSTPPTLYTPITQMLSAVNLNRSHGWVHIIVEKPFGQDLESMQSLNRQMLEVFTEDQIYRIDHYLGKETVQNIVVLRFANGIFEPLWNRHYIDHVQITAAENLGIEGRGGYYDQAGALRDMIQNHLFQVFTMVAMEPPVSLDSNAVRDEKTKVMSAVRPIGLEQVQEWAVRGQYSEGAVDGRSVEGYRQEKNVRPGSMTETYAAIKLLVDNWRWAGVPFYLRSGKRMPKRVTEVSVHFHKAPHLLFKESAPSHSNALILRIQHDEGINLKFEAKLPGPALNVRPVNMDFRYGTSFGKRPPKAYERLLLDAMLGDSTLFARADMLELSWELLMPILESWKRNREDPPLYQAGSWGPSESDEFIKRDGRRWRRP
ncbi:MAG: glucose-6-phosphate dehydrogenase [Acidobacteriota bacterium]